MTHSDVIIGHVITSSVKLHQEAPLLTLKGIILVYLQTLNFHECKCFTNLYSILYLHFINTPTPIHINIGSFSNMFAPLNLLSV